jgi:hypothetical protein
VLMAATSPAVVKRRIDSGLRTSGIILARCGVVGDALQSVRGGV